MLRFLDWDLSLPTCCYITEMLVTRSFSQADWAQSQRLMETSSNKLFGSFTEMKTAFLRAVKEVRDRNNQQYLNYRHAHYFRYLIFICKRKA